MASEHRFLKIVLTGPESSGKTTLAAALAAALGVHWAPEFARHYVAHLGRPYTRADLKQIAAGQRSWERWYAGRPAVRPYLILDTDWTVLQIWEQYRFGAETDFEWQKGYGVAEAADLYLLCAPDFPWHPDPLREHPEERAVLFDLYERLLSGLNARFTVLRGDPAARLETALAAFRELL